MVLFTGQWVEERVTWKRPLVNSSATEEDKPLVETRAHVCCEGRCYHANLSTPVTVNVKVRKGCLLVIA